MAVIALAVRDDRNRALRRQRVRRRLIHRQAGDVGRKLLAERLRNLDDGGHQCTVRLRYRASDSFASSPSPPNTATCPVSGKPISREYAPRSIVHRRFTSTMTASRTALGTSRMLMATTLAGEA